MELQCPHCGAPIPAQNVNIQKTLAVCNQCNHVFDFSDIVLARKSKPRKPPRNLLIHEADDRLELSYQRVFGPGPKLGLTMVSLASVLLPLVLLTFTMKGSAPPSLWILFSVVTCVFWYILAVFLATTTRVTVDLSALKVHSSPLPFPWLDNRTVSTCDVRRVFCEDTVEEWPPGPPGMPAHHVTADLYDGDTVRLVTSLPRDYALYIADAIDAYLQVNDSSSLLADTSEMATDTEMLLGTKSDEQDERAERS